MMLKILLIIIDNDWTILESNLDNLNPDERIIKRQQTDIVKCYQLIDRDAPCSDCPIQKKENISPQQKIGHTLSDQFFQETITSFHNQNLYLLIVEEITRKVVLIEKIREQHQTIQNQKDLFADLSDTMLFMHKTDNTQKVCDGFLESILLKINANAGALLIEDYKKNDLWIRSKLSISEKSIDTILNKYLSLPTRNRSIQELTFEDLPEAKQKWEFIPLLDPKKNKMGVLILDMEIDEEKQQIITLYSEPITAYLSNTILTKKLRMIAHTDGLTGLYNRYYLMKCVKKEEDRFFRLKTHYSIVLGDVNGLKPINDNYGHEAGDELLLRITDCLKSVCRKTDVIARLGGDEFCILLPDTASVGTSRFIERIDEWCKDKYLEYAGQRLVPLSISLGFGCSESIPIDKLIQEADEKMFDAKKEYYKTHKKYR